MEQEELIRGKILGIGYNTISVKVRTKTKSVYIDGLNKRVLTNMDLSDLVKRFDLEFIPNSWGSCEGFRFIEKCDICKIDFSDDLDFNEERFKCEECNKSVCFSCFHKEQNLCDNCYKKMLVRIL